MGEGALDNKSVMGLKRTGDSRWLGEDLQWVHGTKGIILGLGWKKKGGKAGGRGTDWSFFQ